MKLTLTEERVLNQICKGLIAKQIAGKLGISVRTVESHLANAREKNQARTTYQLCAMWTQERFTNETANQPGVASLSYVPLGNTAACG